MAQVIVGHAKARRADATSVVARVVVEASKNVSVADAAGRPEGRIEIRVADRRLAESVSRGVASALERAIARVPPEGADRVVRFRTGKRLAALETRGIEGALAIVEVTAANARRLGEYVERACRAGALGVQIVWDGETPGRDRAERWVFEALERARARTGAPVVLARTTEPLEILRMSIRARAPEPRREEPR